MAERSVTWLDTKAKALGEFAFYYKRSAKREHEIISMYSCVLEMESEYVYVATHEIVYLFWLYEPNIHV